MKAVVVSKFGGPEVLQYVDVNTPTIAENEVLIRVEATSVNFADIKARNGNKGKKVPFIPGLDATGIVDEVGAAVTNVKEGDRVIAFPKNGSYAQYAVASDLLTFPIPQEISTEVAAASPTVSFLSFKLLKDIARMEEGETILIHAAAGGVGTTAIQMAKLFGAKQVIGTVGSEGKKAIAKEAGADHAINYREENFAEKVNELTGGQGVDIILDSIAGKVTEKSLECLAPYGRLVHFGNASGEVGNIQTKDLHSSCRSILGYSFGTTRSKRPHQVKPIADQVIPLLAEKKIDIKIGKSFRLQEAAEAQKWVEERHSTGKVIMTVEQ